VQARSLAALLLIVAALLLRGAAPSLSPLLVSLALLALIPEVYAFFLSLYCGGWPLTELYCFKSYCASADRGGNCTYVGVEVVDCRHGCYDLSEKEFFNLSTTLFHGGFAAPSVDYIVVVHRRRFYVVLRSRSSIDEARSNLCEALRSLGEALSIVGCSWVPLEGVQLLRILRPDVLKPSRKSIPSRALVLVAATLPLALQLYSLVPLSLAACLAIVKGWSAQGYTSVRPQSISTIESVNSFYTFPTTRDILSRSRTLYSLLPRDSYIAIRVEPASIEEEQAIDAEAYRSYEIGTALEKLSLIHKSSKFFAATRRRWERREALYRVSGIVIADERFKRLLARIGIKLSNLPVGLEVLQ